MDLSIITVNLNNKNGLKNTIHSIINQSCKNFEWIVIDGNSTDGSKDLIKEHYHYISYWVSESDKGIYDAMNKGIKVATGKYILFLNSGDILFSNDIIDYLIQQKHNEDIVVYDILLQDRGEPKKKDLSNLTSLSLVSFLFRSTFPHQSTLIKKELFDTYGLYNLNYKYIADWVFFYQMCVVNDASFIYKKGQILSSYDMTGISSQNKAKVKSERTAYLKSFYSARMYEYLSSCSSKESEFAYLRHPAYRFIFKCLQWISNKL